MTNIQWTYQSGNLRQSGQETQQCEREISGHWIETLHFRNMWSEKYPGGY